MIAEVKDKRTDHSSCIFTMLRDTYSLKDTVTTLIYGAAVNSIYMEVY